MKAPVSDCEPASEVGATIDVCKKPLPGDDALVLSKNLRHQYPELVDQLASALHAWRSTVDSTQ